MSRILQALEKVHKEGKATQNPLNRRGSAGVFALPSAVTRSISLRKSALSKFGWVSALPRPPKESGSYAALADHLRGKLPSPCRILVCGVGQGAGATAASLNLSTELALTAGTTALWCELPADSIGIRALLGSACRYGLLDHLFQDIPLREALLRSQVPQLALLAGRGWKTPVLRTPSVEDLDRLFVGIRDRYPDRYVLVDAPPPTASHLTVGLAQRFEATVLVVATGTPEATIREAKEAIGEPPWCAVLINHVPRWFHR